LYDVDIIANVIFLGVPKMKKIASLILALLPIAAHAEGLSGPYVGGTLGYIASEDKGVGHMQGSTDPNGWTHKASPDYAGIALFGGYNWALTNNVFAGVEGDYELRSGSKRVDQKYYGVTDTRFTFKSQVSDAFSIRGRVGYAASDAVKLFATAGYAAAKVKRTFQDLPFSETESHTKWQDGWTAGLGMDYAFSKNLAARVEYRYADYGKKNVSANLWGEYYKQELTEQGLRLGAVYSF
jgi:outer membrane immunogenic protein